MLIRQLKKQLVFQLLSLMASFSPSPGSLPPTLPLKLPPINLFPHKANSSQSKENISFQLHKPHSILSSFHNLFHVGYKPPACLLEPLISFPSWKSILKEITSQCSICYSTTPQGLFRPPPFPTHQARGFAPAQDWQIDFTHMPQVRKLKYLLVWVDTFTGWVEAFPTGSEKATVVISSLLSDIIPRFGQFCLIQGLFFLCGSSTYMCLPANWTGTCTLVFLTPKIQFANGTEELPVPLMTPTQQKRVIPLIPRWLVQDLLPPLLLSVLEQQALVWSQVEINFYQENATLQGYQISI